MGDAQEIWMKMRARWSFISISATLGLAWVFAFPLVTVGDVRVLPLSLLSFVLVE